MTIELSGGGPMDDGVKTLAVMARFRDHEVVDFETIKQRYGLIANSEVVRLLVRQEARRLKEQEQD